MCTSSGSLNSEGSVWLHRQSGDVTAEVFSHYSAEPLQTDRKMNSCVCLSIMRHRAHSPSQPVQTLLCVSWWVSFLTKTWSKLSLQGHEAAQHLRELRRDHHVVSSVKRLIFGFTTGSSWCFSKLIPHFPSAPWRPVTPRLPRRRKNTFEVIYLFVLYSSSIEPPNIRLYDWQIYSSLREKLEFFLHLTRWTHRKSKVLELFSFC